MLLGDVLQSAFKLGVRGLINRRLRFLWFAERPSGRPELPPPVPAVSKTLLPYLSVGVDVDGAWLPGHTSPQHVKAPTPTSKRGCHQKVCPDPLCVERTGPWLGIAPDRAI